MDILRHNSGPRREATAESGLPQGSAAGQRGGGAAQAARAKQAPSFFLMPFSGGATIAYVYDATGQVAAEYSTAAPPQVGTLYLTLDHLGSTRLETNDLGAAVAYHDYLPFGEEIPSGLGGRGSLYGAADGLTHKFTGKQRDPETGGSAMQGLDYFESRYYSAAQGRFTSPDEFKGGIVDPFTGLDIETNTALPYADIADPQTLNKYAYVRNNPLRYTDPHGHCLEDACVLEVGGGSAALLYGGAALAGAIGLTGVAVTLYNGADTITSGIKSLGNAISSIFTKSDSKDVPNPNGSKGAPDHQQTADEEAAKMGPKGEREVRVDTPGGEKGSRVIDAAKVENGKVTEATQVVRPNKNGTAPAREVRAARDIENATGVKPKLGLDH